MGDGVRLSREAMPSDVVKHRRRSEYFNFYILLVPRSFFECLADQLGDGFL